MNPVLSSGAASRTSPAVELLTLIRAGRIAQSISVAARLGVADQLAAGPRGASDLARAVGARPDALRRLLRLLAGVGVFAEAGGEAYALTPLGELLRRDREGSLRDLATLLEAPFIRAAWTNLIDGVRTGEPAFDLANGQGLFEYLGDHTEDAVLFDEAMTGASRWLAASVLDAYDFGGFRTLADVGGGHGALLATILDRHPGLRGTLFEQPDVAARATGLLDAAGGGRCEVVGGDMFESVPPGRDAYVLSRIVHDWDDEAAARILANCRSAMHPGARVLLVEMVLPDDGDPSDSGEALHAKLYDMEMLVIGGRERTRAEFRGLLALAGLRLLRVIPTTSGYHVVEASG